MQRLLISATMVAAAVAAELPVRAADHLLSPRVETPPEPPAIAGDMNGIWRAIAYSPASDSRGFFWGTDTRGDVEESAIRRCAHAGGEACDVVSVLRDHRRWNDNDGSGFPYSRCAALAVGLAAVAEPTNWAGNSAQTRREAEETALAQCGGEGKTCRIREWVCT